MISSGLTEFRLAYEVSPIILTNGIASEVPGGLMPIISILQGQDFPDGPLGAAAANTDVESFFARFVPMAGASVVDNAVGTYPFANQSVAANAIITQPLRVSMMMICPVKTAGGYASKLATFSNLQAQLAKHNSLGGTYTVATPSFLYTDCLLTSLQDAGGDGAQLQTQWRWDFVQPLLTLEAAREAQNSLMRKLSNGTQVTGDPPSPSGQQPAVGLPPSGQGAPTIPAARSLAGASASGAAQ